MNRNWSEALVRRGSTAQRWAGALFAAVAMTVGVAPAFAADVNTLDLQISQNPNPAVYGATAAYTVKLTNTSNKTVNNAGITVTAPAGTGSFDVASPSCTLPTGVACAAPVRNGPVFKAAGYQLPGKGTLTITVGYYMPAAASPPATLVLNVAGTSSNNSTGPGSAAYTTVATSYATVFAPPPPVYPQIQILMTPPANPVLWSTPSCASAPNDRDCGANYYGQYTVTVKNAGSVAIPSSQPFIVDLSSLTGTFAGSFGCAAPCQPDPTVSTRFKVTGLNAGLSAGDSVSFDVLYKSPQQSATTQNLDVTATAIVGPLFTPIAVAALSPAPTHTETTLLTDAAIGTYSSLVPTVGGSAKAKDALPDTGNGPGPFSSRVDVPGYTLSIYPKPIDIVLKVKPGTTSCSSWSPTCLETELDVQSNGDPVTFAPNAPLDGSQLVITMVREWTTLGKKPPSVFNATIWYTDPAGNRTAIKDCGSVVLTQAERCVAQRIDMTTSAKGVVTGGYVKFVIWARHNGKIGY